MYRFGTQRSKEGKKGATVELEDQTNTICTKNLPGDEKQLTVAIPNIIEGSRALGNRSRSKGRNRCGEGEGSNSGLHG